MWYTITFIIGAILGAAGVLFVLALCLIGTEFKNIWGVKK